MEDEWKTESGESYEWTTVREDLDGSLSSLDEVDNVSDEEHEVKNVTQRNRKDLLSKADWDIEYGIQRAVFDSYLAAEEFAREHEHQFHILGGRVSKNIRKRLKCHVADCRAVRFIRGEENKFVVREKSVHNHEYIAPKKSSSPSPQKPK